MVSETIANLCLTLQMNIANHHCTSEPSEHGFGNTRKSNHEFTVADFCILAEKEKLRMNSMFEGNISPSQSANKGYASIFLEWAVNACDVNTSDNALPVVDQLWPITQKIVCKSVKLVTPLLMLFGTETDSLSPFCK